MFRKDMFIRVFQTERSIPSNNRSFREQMFARLARGPIALLCFSNFTISSLRDSNCPCDSGSKSILQ